MELRAVDLTDDDLLTRVGKVVRRSVIEGRPHAAHFDVAAWVAALRAEDSGERTVLLAATEADAVLGAGLVTFTVHDNLDKTWCEVQVDPTARRRGVGAALLDAVVEIARGEHRTLLVVDTKTPFDQVETHPDVRFALDRGWETALTEVVREQPLPVPDDTLDALAARAAERFADYHVETHRNEFPDELATSLCTLLAQLPVDAPSGTLDYEEETVTPQRLAERQATVTAMGWDLYETVAVTADGVVAAQSTLAAPRDNPDGHQWGTFVHREHRGHRLGLAVKVAGLRAVQRTSPHLTRVITQNAETNRWMIAINEELGYRPVEASVELVRRL